MYKIKHTTIESALLGFCRISNINNWSKKNNQYKKYHSFIQDVFYKLKNKTNVCDLGLLWNALTEKNEKETLISFSKEDNPLLILADSGGLQQITLGIKVDEQGVLDIFERQHDYATHAMSFDTMPVRVKESKREDGAALTMDHSAKYFIKELRYQAGRDSGKDLLNQCKTFAELEDKNHTGSKILAIVQGSSFEDYKEYARGLFSVFDELDPDTKDLYLNQIDGISVGMSGITNYFDLVDIYCRLPIELTEAPEQLRSMIHYLGAGGPTKIAPMYALKDNFFNKNLHFTFDSTSRSSVSTYGRFTSFYEDEHNNIKTSVCNLGRDYNDKVQEHLTDIYSEFKDIIQKYFDDANTIEEFRNNFSPYAEDGLRLSKEIQEEFGEDNDVYIKRTGVHDFLHWATEVVKFFKILEHYHSGNFNSLNDKKLRYALKYLNKLSSYEDYMNNRETFKKLLGFKRLTNINVIDTLEEFENLDKDPFEDF